MKQIHGDATKRTLGVCMLMATLLFGAAVAKADVVLDWNVIAVNTAVTNGQNPFAQARYAAIVQLAVFESVNAITGEYHPYLGTIVAPPGACPEAAAIQAAYRVLSTYFTTSATTLAAERATDDGAHRQGPDRASGNEIGAHAVLAGFARHEPVDRLQRALGHRHPVVRRHRPGRVEVHPNDRTTRVDDRQQRLGQ